MADYPNTTYDPRTKENKPGVTYDPSKSTVGYVEDVVKLDDEVVAIENELGTNPSGDKDNIQKLLITKRVKAPDSSGLKLRDDANNFGIFIDDGGNVGIGGITSPSYALDINGDINIATGQVYRIAGSQIDWGDTAMATSDVSASDVGLGNVENVALSGAGWADIGIATSDITSANWGDYEIQKNGTDGSGIINFKTT